MTLYYTFVKSEVTLLASMKLKTENIYKTGKHQTWKIEDTVLSFTAEDYNYSPGKKMKRKIEVINEKKDKK